MDEKRREYMRQYMAKKRATDDKKPVSDDATLGTRDVVTSVDPPEQEKPVEEASTAVVVASDRKLTSTDQKFDEDRPGWYIFGEEIKEGKCWTCGKPFKTQLEMNRFCSPKCKNEYLASISSSKNDIPV
jgi:endogenous inhibitor of DNA gyrase (YacG/DUF329 family)